ncbi:unnamed protein product, partial [Anisakis simplex]|uniref:EGF-like domain-containing protein n=1 Tax=Anisakis simplex TaxID=6269 RepID=A0A0M3J2U4_ANISI
MSFRGTKISHEFMEIACDHGCPLYSHCENGTCHCDDGFTGSTKEGCVDVDECEQNPCTETDSWCVNLHGSFECCTTQSNVTNCVGLVIKTGSGLELTNGNKFIANKVEQSTSEGEAKGDWRVETIGEWRNFSG